MLFDLLKFLAKRAFATAPAQAPKEQQVTAGVSLPTPVYDPTCFDASSVEAAKEIILTPEYASTEDRWQMETPLDVEAIIRECRLAQGQVVLDYGCGIGRIARELPGRTGVFVIGVDISRPMRRLAAEYVSNDDLFVCVSPAAMDRLICNGLRVDAAYSIWVLQHCLQPEVDIERIQNALKPGGRFHLVNNLYRAVPTQAGWVNDGIDIRALLKQRFKETNHFHLQAAALPDFFKQYTYCATYENAGPA
jgi:SAM-dependent methyltransferase